MKSFAAILGLAATAAAHSTWQELWVNGVDKAGTCVRLPPNNNPINGVTTNDIACNVGGSTGVSGVCDVAAGQTVTAEMHAQPGDRSCANEAIGGNHDGPILFYLAKVADAKTANPNSASWFKVAQYGYDSASKTWGNQVLNKNCGKYTFTIPKSIASGNYLLRAEVIALHVAGSVGGAQPYVSCYQINVTGGGSANPAGVKFPGAYSATDPGILFNLYQNPLPAYQIPGPAVYTG